MYPKSVSLVSFTFVIFTTLKVKKNGWFVKSNVKIDENSFRYRESNPGLLGESQLS